MNTIEQVKEAVESGQTVYWSSRSYKLRKDPKGEWWIDCSNGYITPLNGHRAEDFFTESQEVSEDASDKVRKISKVEIKPCPFCGGTNIKFDCHVGQGNLYIKGCHNLWSTCCYDCGATFPNRYSKKLLIDCWNRRPNS